MPRLAVAQRKGHRSKSCLRIDVFMNLQQKHEKTTFLAPLAELSFKWKFALSLTLQLLRRLKVFPKMIYFVSCVLQGLW